MSTLTELMAADQASQMQTYGRAPIAFVRGEGVHLFDQEGKRYLDLLSGIAVTGLGHCHPDVVAAVTAQATTLDHVSNLYLTEPQIKLAQALTALAGFESRVFFANSGAEANECALKLARRYSVVQHGKARSKVVALDQSFHGRTFATLAATGQASKHAPFAPLPDWFVHVSPNDPTALADAIDSDTCAVLLEVVQGEGGVRPISDDMLAVARSKCDEVGAVLIFDEVQTGIGRLGEWFGFQTTDVVPDVLTVAKALANGLPIGACIGRAEFAAAFEVGDHATTFGGGPIPCAAALATLEVIDRDDLLTNVKERGKQLSMGLAEMDDPRIKQIRGRGLLQGVLLHSNIANDVVDAARDRGVILGTAGPDVLRFAPPLIVSTSDIAEGLQVLGQALEGTR